MILMVVKSVKKVDIIIREIKTENNDEKKALKKVWKTFITKRSEEIITER